MDEETPMTTTFYMAATRTAVKYHKIPSCASRGRVNTYKFTREETDQLHRDGRLCERCVLCLEGY